MHTLACLTNLSTCSACVTMVSMFQMLACSARFKCSKCSACLMNLSMFNNDGGGDCLCGPQHPCDARNGARQLRPEGRGHAARPHPQYVYVCMYMYMYMYMYVCIYIYIYTHIHTHTHYKHEQLDVLNVKTYEIHTTLSFFTAISGGGVSRCGGFADLCPRFFCAAWHTRLDPRVRN